jgi:glycosyltransferase involved in cell wall biosynthesis
MTIPGKSVVCAKPGAALGTRSPSSEDRLSVTVIVPVKDDAALLPELLSGLKDFARVVVVDSLHDPATQRIAAEHSADVLVFTWDGQYPKKRNWALANAEITTDWVLFLDSDERVTPQFIQAIRATLPSTTHAGFWLRYNIFFLGRELRHGIPQRKLALVRTGHGEYERIDEDRWSSLDMEIHEHVIVRGTTGTIEARLTHLDARSIHKYCTRHADYASWEARRYLLLGQTRDSATLTLRQRVKYAALNSMFFPVAYFFLQYIVRLGFLDRRAGMLFAILKMGYFAQVQAKVAEARLLNPNPKKFSTGDSK